jgi:hypothetical protein
MQLIERATISWSCIQGGRNKKCRQNYGSEISDKAVIGSRRNERIISKMTDMYDIASCSLVEVDGRFRGAYCLHYHSDK